MNPENVKIPNEFDDAQDWWPHEVCKRYEASRDGVVRNIETKNHVGCKEKDGYLRIGCLCCGEKGKNKTYYKHRFIYECFFGLIKDKKVVDHINNIKSDNRLENLQLISKSENSIKDYKYRDKTPIRVKATNVENGETFIYKSIYGASKDLKISCGSISNVLSGLTNTALSKKYNERFTFKKLDKPFKYSDIQNIKIKLYKSNKNNINIYVKLLRERKKNDE